MYSMRQTVLIISDDAQHQEIMLTSMACQGVLASSLEGRRILSRCPAAATVLDSGIASWGLHQKNDRIQGVVKYLAGRVILVFGETPDPQAMELAP